MSTKPTWSVLSQINCNDHTEKKNGLTYLSWAWAWGIVKMNFPSANYEVKEYEGKPYLFDADLGYMIQTRVTIDGETIPMHLFVMDGANNAQKNVRYSYKVNEYVNGKKTGQMIDKWVEPATMFDINTTIMRCLTKNLAMFGLGHYIYAGEDLPMESDETKAEKKAAEDAKKQALLSDAIAKMAEVKAEADRIAVWGKFPSIQKEQGFINAAIEAAKRIKEA
jgi:hypothetical protein